MTLFEIAPRINPDAKDWYHGSSKSFMRFSAAADPVNQAITKPTGIYLTRSYELAHQYANMSGVSGYVYRVNVNLNRVFLDGHEEVTRQLQDAYRKTLARYYRDPDTINDMVSEFRQTSKFSNKIKGKDKTAILVDCGFDAFAFQDFEGMSLVVFNPNKLKIAEKL